MIDVAPTHDVGARRDSASAGGGSRADPRSALPLVLSVLPIAALTELLLMRTFYRVGLYLPKEGSFRVVHSASTAVGSWAFNLSAVLAVFALAMLAHRAWGNARRGVAVGLAGFLALSMLATATGALGVAPVVRISFGATIVLLIRPALRGSGDRVHRAALGAIGAAVLLSAAAAGVGDVGRVSPVTMAARGIEPLQLAGEAIVVVSAFLVFAAWVREPPVRLAPMLLGVVPAALLLAAWRGDGAATGIIALWTVGLRLYLPQIAYVLALWAFAAAATGWLRTRPFRSAGLVLLFAGGFLMDSTYLLALVLLGVVLLTDGAAVGGPPGARRAASGSTGT